MSKDTVDYKTLAEFVNERYPNLNETDQMLFLDGYIEGYKAGLIYAAKQVNNNVQQDTKLNPKEN